MNGHGGLQRVHVGGSGFADSDAAGRCHRDRSAKMVQVSPAQDTADKLDQGIDPILVRAQQQDATVSPWRICPDVTESFIGCD